MPRARAAAQPCKINDGLASSKTKSIATIAVTAIANLPQYHCASGRLLCKHCEERYGRCAIFLIEARMISWRWGDFQKEICAQESHALNALQQTDLQVRCSAVVFVFDGQ
jgi:hypothetical protein